MFLKEKKNEALRHLLLILSKTNTYTVTIHYTVLVLTRQYYYKNIVLYFLYCYHRVDTSVGGLLVPEGIIRPEVSVWALTSGA